MLGERIAVLDRSLQRPVWKELFSLGRKSEWTLLDLRYTGNTIPRGIKPDGALVAKLPDDPFVTKLRTAGCHVVRLGKAPHPMDKIIPAVLPDLERTGKLAAEHLAERGFRRFGIIKEGDLGIYWNLFEGFRTRGDELGCECHELRWDFTDHARQEQPREYLYRKRLDSFRQWLSGLSKPIGLLAITDDRAALCNRMCSDAGFDVPAEVAILGVGNDSELCETLYPSLSSVIPNGRAIAKYAFELLDQLSTGQTINRSPVLVPPAGIVTRQSTDIIAADSPEVARASGFMMKHHTEQIDIKDITRIAGVCRAKLFTAFDKELGQPPGAVLTRLRIDRAKRMLSGTDEKVPTIAEACGFGASINMYHHFKRNLGLSPSAYRRKHSEQD